MENTEGYLLIPLGLLLILGLNDKKENSLTICTAS